MLNEGEEEIVEHHSGQIKEVVFEAMTNTIFA